MAAVECIDLVLTVNKADGLAAKDTNLFGVATKSDPYIEVRLIPRGSLVDEAPVAEKDKIFLGKTEIKRKTLSPKWDESFSVAVPRTQFGELALFELTIYDWDRTTSDDLMGVVPVHIPLGRWGTSTKWYGVPASSAEGEQATGRVQCTISLEHSKRTPEQIKQFSESGDDDDKDSDTEDGGKVEVMHLKLTIKRASGLAAMDKNIIGMKTKSDPYIEVRLCPKGPGGGDQSKIFLGKTEPKLKTLNPHYNQMFEAPPLSLKSFTENACFEGTIMDFDDGGEDDLMGVVTIPIPLNKPGSTTKWYQVPKDSGEGGKASGTVQCMLSVVKDLQQTVSHEETDLRLKAAFAAKSRKPKGPPPPRCTPVKPQRAKSTQKPLGKVLAPPPPPQPKPAPPPVQPRMAPAMQQQQQQSTAAAAPTRAVAAANPQQPAYTEEEQQPRVSVSKCLFCEKADHKKEDCPEWLEFQAFKKSKHKEKEEEEERRMKSMNAMRDRFAKRTSSSGSTDRPRRSSDGDGKRRSSGGDSTRRSSDGDKPKKRSSRDKSPKGSRQSRGKLRKSKSMTDDIIGERSDDNKRRSMRRQSSMGGPRKSGDKGERRSIKKGSSHHGKDGERRVKRSASIKNGSSGKRRPSVQHVDDEKGESAKPQTVSPPDAATDSDSYSSDGDVEAAVIKW